MCPYCGRLVVRLRLPDSRKTIVCYLKGWDGNPWFSRLEAGPLGHWFRESNASIHPKHRKVTAEQVAVWKKRAEEKKAEDPFFSLE